MVVWQRFEIGLPNRLLTAPGREPQNRPDFILAHSRISGAKRPPKAFEAICGFPGVKYAAKLFVAPKSIPIIGILAPCL
jgi:hypothetical protein